MVRANLKNLLVKPLRLSPEQQRARRQMRLFFKKLRKRQTELAQELGVSRAVISSALRRGWVSDGLRAKIYRKYGIWLEDLEREKEENEVEKTTPGNS